MSVKPNLPIALLILMSAGSPASAQQKPAEAASAPAKPAWVRLPTGDDVDRFYPSMAEKANKSGAVLMGCSVEPAGTLANCRIYREEPEGYGFGAAVLKMKNKFRLRNDSSGTPGPVEHWVLVPLKFAISDSIPLNDYQIGDESAVLTGAKPDGPLTADSAMTCVANSDTAHCQGHKFDWTAKPDNFLADAPS